MTLEDNNSKCKLKILMKLIFYTIRVYDQNIMNESVTNKNLQIFKCVHEKQVVTWSCDENTAYEYESPEKRRASESFDFKSDYWTQSVFHLLLYQ